MFETVRLIASSRVQSVLLLGAFTLMVPACGHKAKPATTPTPATTPFVVPDTVTFVDSLFADHMVLERHSPAVFGWTTPGATVSVAIPELSVDANTTAGSDGRWVVHFGEVTAGGPYTLNITGPQSATINDVLVGEVWLSAGQSNSYLSLDYFATTSDYDAYWQQAATTEVNAANDGNLRLFLQQWYEATEPRRTTAGGVWQTTTPDSAGSFAAEAYLFAHAMQQQLGVPVGIIEASLGGTNIRQWVETADATPLNLPAFAGVATSSLYNGMIAPLQDLSLAGATWYQGESDCSGSPDTLNYQTLLTALFHSWRTTIGSAKLPILVVQLPNYGPVQSAPVEDSDGYDAAAVRDAELHSVLADSNAALVTTIDIGDANTIHPPNKWDVGARLEDAAMGAVYGAVGDSQGPLFSSATLSGSEVTIHFTQATSGLIVGQKSLRNPVQAVPGGILTGFAITDASYTWVAATATISGQTVVVSASGVTAPVAVRYGWAANPTCNLYNADGLPASPFRSDTQPLQ